MEVVTEGVFLSPPSCMVLWQSAQCDLASLDRTLFLFLLCQGGPLPGTGWLPSFPACLLACWCHLPCELSWNPVYIVTSGGPALASPAFALTSHLASYYLSLGSLKPLIAQAEGGVGLLLAKHCLLSAYKRKEEVWRPE